MDFRKHPFPVRVVLALVASGAIHAVTALGSRNAKPVDADKAHEEHMALFQRLLAAHAETETEDTKYANANLDGTGVRAKGEEGSMGNPSETRAPGLAEAAEFGMIGLSGTGEGVVAPWADERAGFGSGHGRLGGGHDQGPSAIGAGEWDDNANYRDWKKLLAKGGAFRPLDVSDRTFLVVRDANGKPIPSCDVTITDAQGAQTKLRTMSSGRALFFPRAERMSGEVFDATARCGGNLVRASFTASEDAVVEMKGSEPRGAASSIDVAFALDTTGSMVEEIAAVKSTLRHVAAALQGTEVRVGLVEYKDRGDAFVTKVYAMESDVDRLSTSISNIDAVGGGDTPEDMEAGLHDALTKLAWSASAAARLLFVIADAPPHLDYERSVDYRDSARLAAREGIQIHAIAASGMDDLGQMVFRQIAQYTGGTELFVLRGGAGPQSTGGGDPRSSCGGTQQRYTSGNLDALILAHVDAARRALDADPMIIAGLHKDVGAIKCRG